MVFKADRQVEIPAKDVLSYIFDNPSYDQNKPILYCMLVLAIIGVGGVFTGTNPSYTSAEIAHHIKASKTKYVISEPEILDPVIITAKENNIPRQNIWIFDPIGQPIPPGWRSWRELLNFGEDDWIRFNDIDTSRKTTAARLFSSGTTGLPKGANITHCNFISQQQLTIFAHPRPYPISRVVALPIFHAAAAPSTHVGALAGGEVIYMMRRFELQLFLRTVEKYGTTEMPTVPPIVLAIVKSPYSRTRPFLKSVRSVTCGAAPLDKSLQARLSELLKDNATFNQVWGMTETSCIATMFPCGEQDHTGSVGRLVPNLEVKLIDDNGNDISAFGVHGEICVRGPTVTPGYFESPQANTDSFDSDGYFKTGDIGYCDEATRKWYIVDRKKELIKVRGFQVAPPELEAVLLSHPQIVDAAVIGISLPGGDGESPRAYVVRQPGSAGARLTEEEVKDYLKSRLASYKALTGGVKFVDNIAKNASGKILKRMLREQSKRELESEILKPKL
ncbi:hypothetical protein UA08_03148 [Talaromyces atroroseus]|uniref:AMP-binding enzyme n=1 Tax=Talaromyces atroroseus TaxID=1441469 RepID=A0A225APK7_TALAT|nr:hypothetical protein UA08_03148 [Talaromyces atroroseus]OKL61423.1 hypothetical protein UA08_03148 [Talaromyces atroroseus]